MLLQSGEGFIRIFPYLPEGTAAAFERLSAEGGFLVSAQLEPTGTVSGLMIEGGPHCAGTVSLLSPWPRGFTVAERGGAAVPTVAVAGGHGERSWPTKPGVVYVVTAAA